MGAPGAPPPNSANPAFSNGTFSNPNVPERDKAIIEAKMGNPSHTPAPSSGLQPIGPQSLPGGSAH